VLPLISTLFKASSKREAPLKRPAAFASLTVPLARAPLGIATLPSISMGVSTVASKACPGVAVLELSDSSRTTSIGVSAGTTNGLGMKTSLIEEDLDLPELEPLLLAVVSVAESEFAA